MFQFLQYEALWINLGSSLFRFTVEFGLFHPLFREFLKSWPTNLNFASLPFLIQIKFPGHLQNLSCQSNTVILFRILCCVISLKSFVWRNFKPFVRASWGLCLGTPSLCIKPRWGKASFPHLYSASIASWLLDKNGSCNPSRGKAASVNGAKANWGKRQWKWKLEERR